MNQITTDKIGLFCRGPGLGDDLIMSSLPENFYKNTGIKLIDVNNHWMFDFNPYIQRNVKPDAIFTNTQIQDDSSTIISRLGIKQLFSLPWKINHFFSLTETVLRHPKLYKYEDSETVLNKICVHTTAKTIGGTMSDEVIDVIKNNYKRYEIFQVGGKEDKQFSDAVDLRGLDFWETAKQISSAAIMISVDSGLNHLATAYPKVRKKVINYYITKEDMMVYTPLFSHASWLDFGYENFCPFKRDIGCFMSYLKI